MQGYANTTKKNSWHGTSIQLVQPRHSLSLVNVSPRKRKADDQNQENKGQHTGTEETELNSTTQTHTCNPCDGHPSTPTQTQQIEN